MPLFSHIASQIPSLSSAMLATSCDCKELTGMSLFLRRGFGTHASSVGTTWSTPNPRIQLCNMQQACTSFTCVLYLWNGLLSMIRKRFFKAPNALSMVVLSELCLRLKSSFEMVGCVYGYTLIGNTLHL